MNIVICDGENVTRSQIREYIMAEDVDVHIQEVKSAEELLEKRNADMIFLDIQSEQTEGLRTAKALRKEGVDIPIIFVAATKDYVFDAFDVNAFQYLVKPVERKTLCYVYQRAKQHILRNQCRSEKTLVFNTKKMNYFLKRNQILYAENDGKKIVLHTTAGENVVIYGTMQSLAKRLGDGFYRCHRGYLVNMSHIVGYKGDSIQIDNGESVYLSRDKYSDFVRVYGEFVGKM